MAGKIVIVTSTSSALEYATVKSDQSDSADAQITILVTCLEITLKIEFGV